MGLPSNSDLIYQQAWLSTELQHMFEIMSNRQVGGCATDVMANRKVQAKFAKLSSGNDDQEDDGDEAASTKRKSLDENADCPICFDEMSMDTTASASITFCRAACGSNFHATCMRAWLQQGSTTCPNCRQPWEDGSNKGSAATNKEGYTNLGNLQGQEAQRDESTYSEWYGGSPYHRRKKYRRRW
uniref:RING-type domain-containing protein n=1 Tax=Grammatophora oceanica TaxID=210454 RepID=A0A7S1VDY6_9STRA|mmetsp:Transcript_43943/g.65178  ORF Transcript_43943/g.65178 Transcript_43943/m.65178 type:complete len:185 (+) Transcript_43943:2-556(+)